jgi:hypothetical protein
MRGWRFSAARLRDLDDVQLAATYQIGNVGLAVENLLNLEILDNLLCR